MIPDGTATSSGSAGQELFCLVAVTEPESLAFISHLAWLVVDIPGTPCCEAGSEESIEKGNLKLIYVV
jgi:hypothetical protein